MQENIQVRFKKQKNNPHLDLSIYKKNSSPLCPDRIPPSQIKKFQTTLHFLKQAPIHNNAEQQFIQKIQHQAFISRWELNKIIRSVKVDKDLLLTIRNYFALCFNHKREQKNVLSVDKPLISYGVLQEQDFKMENEKDEQNGMNEQKIYDRLIMLSSYETLRVKILIEALLFLKDIYKGKFIHKKLINEFQRLQLIKKLQILQSPSSSVKQLNKQQKQNNKITKKSSIYFRQKQFLNEKSKDYIKQNHIMSKHNNFSQDGMIFTIIKSKIYTIMFLQYEKLQSSQKLFLSHHKLLLKTIKQRQNRLKFSQNSYYHSILQTNHSKLQSTQSKVDTNQQTIQFDNRKSHIQTKNDQNIESNYKLRMDYENLTAYLVLKSLKLKINQQSKNKESNVLKELKIRKNECKNVIEKLQQSLGSIVKLRNSPQIQVFKSYITSKKMYLKSLNQILNQMKRSLQRQLIGEQIDTVNAQNSQHSENIIDKNIKQDRRYSKTNYQSVKNSIYELTVNILQQNKRSSSFRNKSNQRILQQYIKTHNQQKSKNQLEITLNNFLSTNSNAQTVNNIHQNNTNESKQNKLNNKARSLTKIRQNLHKNIFPKDESTSFSKTSKSFSKRSKSLLNNKNQTSIKTLLQSPLNRQIEIFLEYQKFLNSLPQETQNHNPSQLKSEVSENQFKQNQQTLSKTKTKNQNINKTPQNKQQSNGLKLLDDIMKAKNSNNNKLLTSDKKRKIKTIYKAFAHNNKIIDISHWKLQQEIKDSSQGTFFNKNLISTQLTQPISNFGAGLKDFNQALDQLLADRCYMNIRFVKFWQTKPCYFSIRLSQQKNVFTLYLKMNQLTITMLLPRGNNILCQRYHTIWPTIRYLFQKKIFQFPIIKFFQQVFMQKRSNQFNQNKLSTNRKIKTQNLSQSSNKVHPSQFNNKETFNSYHKQTVSNKPSNFKNNQKEQTQKKKSKKLIGKDSIVSSTASQLYQHNQLEENQCSVYEFTFGQVNSDEVQELNSCFDYIYKFMGLICSQIRTTNGKKDIVWPLQDNTNMRQMNQIAEIGESNVDKLFKEDQQAVRLQFIWRRIAKFWVSMQKRESVHLLNFIKKSLQNYYFFSISISKQSVSKCIETFLENAFCHQGLNEKQNIQIKKKYKDIELSFIVSWRQCNKNLFQQTQESSAKITISYERFQLYHLGLKLITDTLMNIIVDNFYGEKTILALKKLFQDSLFVQTSVEGQKVYDLYAAKIQKHKKLYHTNYNSPLFKDLYQNPYSDTLKLIFDFLKLKNGQEQQNSSPIKQNSFNFSTFQSQNFTNQKNQIQVIQNFFDMMTWNHRSNEVTFKPNSKWKIVQRKIHTIITFVNHLSKRNQRKSSVLGNQRIKQTHQFVEANQPKKVQKICPLMMKTLQRVKKSTLNFLQRIQNQVYRIKVNLNQSLELSNQGDSQVQKWMAECILMKENSKQYQKFYISSADIKAIFLSSPKQYSENQNQSFNDSYDLFNSHESKDFRMVGGMKNESFSDKNSNESSIKEEFEQSLRKSSQKQISNFEKEQNRLRQWTELLEEGSNCLFGNLQSKQKKLRMFGKVIRSISFTKIKCFSKILISRNFLSEDGVEHFIAEPRSSLEILHQNIENPQKTFQLKYFVPLQNCYQTIICKPIKISYNGKIDFVIITLFKIDLNQGESIYQFRINLNKNQTYYACEVTETELRILVDFSQQQKMNQNSTFLEQQYFPLFTSLIKSDNLNSQSQKKQKNHPSFVNPNSKIFIDDKTNPVSSHKKRSILKGGQYRKSNLLNVEQFSTILPKNNDQGRNKNLYGACNNFILAMVGKLQQFTKEVLQNIFKHIQIQISTKNQNENQEVLLLTIPKAQFQKVLKIRVLQRISRDKNSIYMVEVNQDNIRRLNQIVLKSSMNNNFDIFQQNIFKNKTRKLSNNSQTDFQCISSESSQKNSLNKENKFKDSLRISCSQFESKSRSNHHQSEINLLFSSFSIFQQDNKTSKKIEVMNSDNVIENIAYEMEKKYGKQLLLKFNNKKIKSYAQIFFNYYLKYIHSTHKQ